MNANFRTVRSAALADWGPSIESIVRRIAVAVAFTYALGFSLGAWLHRTNDRLARAYVAFLGLTPVAAPVAPEVIRTLVGVNPARYVARTAADQDAYDAAMNRASLSRLTVVELRKLARAALGSSARINGRRIAQATKASLLEALS